MLINSNIVISSCTFLILFQSEDSVMNRLNALSAVETKTLLSKCFDKVINLREKERKTDLQCSEMEVWVLL